MRIGCFLPHLELSGGLGFQCRMFLDAIGKASPQLEVEILAPNNPKTLFPKSGLEPWQETEAGHNRTIRLHRLHWPVERPLSLPLDPVLGSELRRLNCDLVFSSYYSGFENPGIPQVVLYHDAGFLEFPERFGPVANQRRQTLEIIAPKLDRIVCISHDARERICKGTGWPHAKTEVIWHCLTDIDPLSARVVDSQALNQPLFPGGCTIASLGRYWFSPVGAATGFNRVRKNVPNLVSQFRTSTTLESKLVVASTGVLDETMLGDLLPQHERDHGSFDPNQGGAWFSSDRRIVLLPNLNRDRFLDAMASSVGIVYPTLFEGFGLPTIESMALGLPLVAQRATSIPEIVEDCALLVDPLDSRGLVHAMETIERDPQTAKNLGERGRKRASEWFLPYHCGKHWISLFEKITGER